MFKDLEGGKVEGVIRTKFREVEGWGCVERVAHTKNKRSDELRGKCVQRLGGGEVEGVILTKFREVEG